MVNFFLVLIFSRVSSSKCQAYTFFFFLPVRCFSNTTSPPTSSVGKYSKINDFLVSFLPSVLVGLVCTLIASPVATDSSLTSKLQLPPALH